MGFSPGDTKPLAFIVPFEASEIVRAVATFTQETVKFLEKESKEFVPLSDGMCEIRFHLSQEESLRLRSFKKCTVIMNIIDFNGERNVSDPLDIDIGMQSNYNIIKEEVD